MNRRWARWRKDASSEGDAVERTGPTEDIDAVRVRLAEALARFPEAQEALRQALIAEGWFVP